MDLAQQTFWNDRWLEKWSLEHKCGKEWTILIKGGQLTWKIFAVTIFRPNILSHNVYSFYTKRRSASETAIEFALLSF